MTKINKKNILIYFLILIFTVFVNVFFRYYYGVKWNEISIVIRLGIVVLWIIYAFNATNKYYENSYVFYKLLGMREWQIEKKLVSNNMPTIIICIYLATLGAGETNILLIPVMLINIFFLLVNTFLLIFRARYKTDILGKAFVVAFSIVIGTIIINSITLSLHSNSIVDFIHVILNNEIINIMDGILSINPYICCANLLIAIIIYKTAFTYDNLICDLTFSIIPRIVFKRRIRIGNRYTNGYIGRNLTPVVTSLKYSLPLIILFIIYLLLGINILNYWEIFMIISLIVIFMTSLSVEYVFREDAENNRRWYVLLGEQYNQFLIKKIVASCLLIVPDVLFYSICSIIKHHIDWGIVIIFMYAVSCVLGWTMFYAGKYFDLRRYYAKHEQILTFFVMWLIMIPLTNVIICINGYFKGKKAWIKYVGC